MKISDFKDAPQISGTVLSLIVFLYPPKKNGCSIRRIFMEQSGIIPTFNIPGTLFGNIRRNFIGNFFECSGNISRKCFTNIPRTYIHPVGNVMFDGQNFFDQPVRYNLRIYDSIQNIAWLKEMITRLVLCWTIIISEIIIRC